MTVTTITAGLSFLWLEITRCCNLTCVHCYADSSPQLDLEGEMALADWLNVIDEAVVLGCSRIQFIGGEPTLHPQLLTMIRHARTAGIASVEVFTNATSINDSFAEAFRQLGGEGCLLVLLR